MIRPGGGDDLVRKIKDSLDIVEIVGSYIELKQRGASHLALCPFHAEKTPSFNVNRQGQFYHCFGCKKSGDVIDFVMAMEGVAFPDALRLLGEKCGIRVERFQSAGNRKDPSRKNLLFRVLESAARRFEQNLQSDAGVEARKYLNRRQIRPDVASRFRLGYAREGWSDLRDHLTRSGIPEKDLMAAGLVKRSERGGVYDLFRNRLMLPIFDAQSRVVGFGGRVLDDSLPKYINSPETEVFHKSRLFYGINLARRHFTAEKTAVVVEGYTDVIMAHCKGVGNTVATLGTALTGEHATLLRRAVEKVILFFDGDEAGSIAAGRGIEVLLGHDLDVTVLALEEGLDPFDYFSRHGLDDFRAMVESKGQDFFDFTLRYQGERCDLSTPGGKAKLARRLLKLVHCHTDLIRKDLLLKKIAQTLGISEGVLRKEYAKLQTHGAQWSGRSRDEDLVTTGSVTITTAEDDLILGLLRAPDLIPEFGEDLRSLETGDREAATILERMVALHGAGQLEVRELILDLEDHPGARNRAIALAADPRRTDPERLVRKAFDSLKKRRIKMEYESIRRKRHLLRGHKGNGSSDRLLREIEKNLRAQKGAGEKTD